MAKALMIQGTGSDVGKSVIVAGLCRIARRKGLSVAPFKPQNMSNNAQACISGGEIGRAQALQARACGLAPHTDFNPVLLKPQTDKIAQIIIQGYPVTVMDAKDYMAKRGDFLDAVMESFNRLSAKYDLILVEGAGSPAEINLRARDIANMGFARQAGVPVCLVGDIERGGVIASVVGTKTVIAPKDAAMITSFIINKFRGDPALFEDGVREIETHTGWPCFGVIPWLHATAHLPAEDAVNLSYTSASNTPVIRIAAPMLSRMANFDDADPLRLEPNVEFQWVPPGKPIPHNIDVIILFGTKSTFGDLAFLRAQGWNHDILAHARAGKRALGLCGGYQMLGKRIFDPDGVDGIAGECEGLGLLDIETIMRTKKTVRPIKGRCTITQTPITGYEIHVGETTGADTLRPFLFLENTLKDSVRKDGARNPNGNIEGSYVHGLFASNEFRTAWLERMKAGASSRLDYEVSVDKALEDFADGLEAALDIEAIFASAQTTGWQA
ncbi:MAG: cobyric acid synthase [Robiginitomaculum sp.]